MDVKKVIMDRPAPEDEVRVDALVMPKKVSLKEQLAREKAALNYAINVLEFEFATYAKVKREAVKRIKAIRDGEA